MIKQVEAYEARRHWTLMKNSEVNNKHKNKYRKLKTISYIWSFKKNIFLYVILMKHKYILCVHEGI